MKHLVYLGLGSNVGDRVEFLAAAIRSIADITETIVDDVSHVYQTQLVGDVEQGDFLNLCLSVRTNLPCESFHREIKSIERFLGRTESVRWGPREIDIDLLFFDSVIVNSSLLIIPHKEIANRKFVLQPLSEIAPLYIHPVFKKTIHVMNLGAVDDHYVMLSEHHTTQLNALINDSITNPIR